MMSEWVSKLFNIEGIIDLWLNKMYKIKSGACSDVDFLSGIKGKPSNFPHKPVMLLEYFCPLLVQRTKDDPKEGTAE